jgi:hypothetical membrane protein
MEGAMATIEIRQGRGVTIAHPANEMTMQKALLMCGVVSSLLYVLIDLIGGLNYDGYSFANQAISELGAIGAPSKPLVDPLFLVYDLLVLAFGVGVFRAAAGRSRALRVTGALLVAYGLIGLAPLVFGSPDSFAMHQRGTGSLTTDKPHIVLTGVLVLMLLGSIGFGAFAFGARFQAYSFATLITVIMFGALTAPYAPHVAAGQPTPGLGIVERIDVYAAFLWIAVLSITLLRQPLTARGDLR